MSEEKMLIYRRQSAKRQEDSGRTSLEMQEEACRTFCEENNLTVLKVFKEEQRA